MWWRRRSFEVLPALRVGGKPLRRSLRLVTMAWMLGVVWMSCISGSQWTLFQRLLGFSNMHFGLIMGIGWAVYLGQVISAYAVERTGIRKYQFIVYASIYRFLWLAIAAVPFIFNPGPTAATAFVVVYAIGAFLAHMSMPPWLNWMGDIIPRRVRGRYFANRRVLTIPIQVLAVIATGLVLDWATVKQAPDTPINIETQPYLLPVICAIFAIGAFFGLADVLLFLRMREVASPPLATRPPRHGASLPRAFAAAAAAPFRAVGQAIGDRDFDHYAGFAFTIAFAMTVAGPFWARNTLENLGYSKLSNNVVFMVCTSLSAMLVAKLWGKLIDRWGRRPVMIMATVGVVFSPAGWFLIPAGSSMRVAVIIGGLTCSLGGVMWGGLELARFNLLLDISQGAARSRYIAAAAVFSAAGGLLGGFAGGWLADSLDYLQCDIGTPLRVGPFLWNNWHITFLVSALFRALAVLWLINMPDRGSRPLRHVMRHIWVSAYTSALPRAFAWRWRAFRRGDGGQHRLLWPLRLILRPGRDRVDKAA